LADDLGAELRELRAAALRLLSLERAAPLRLEQLSVAPPGEVFRLMIYNDGRAPLHVFDGEFIDLTRGRGRPGAGLMYANEEGTECGGLMVGSSARPEAAHAYTTMDHYNQQEAVTIGSEHSAGAGGGSLAFYDQSDTPIQVWVRRLARWYRLGRVGMLLALPGVLRERRRGKWFHARASLRSRVGRRPGAVLMLAAPGRGRARAQLVVDERGPRLELRRPDGRTSTWDGR
jgi:hypothetical protein